MGVIALVVSCSAHAEALVLGPPDGVIKNPDVVTSETVGSLPYSNQWVTEKTSAYLYVSYNSLNLSGQTMSVGEYVSNFQGTQFYYPSIDYFSHWFSFDQAEARSVASNFAVWGRYSLGFGVKSGHLSATQTPIDTSVESNSLLLINASLGPLLGFDRWSWVKPYIGFLISPYFYRNTASISGAEVQGENFSYGPAVGVHFPIFFGGRGSLLAEYRKSLATPGAGQIFANSDNYSGGLGFTF